MTAKNQEIADKAENALNRLSKGESTINEIRQEYGLNIINDDSANKKLIKENHSSFK